MQHFNIQLTMRPIQKPSNWKDVTKVRNSERGIPTTTSDAIIVTSDTIVVMVGTLSWPTDNINVREPSQKRSAVETTPTMGVKSTRMRCISESEDKRYARGYRKVKSRMNVSRARIPNKVRVEINVATNLLRFLPPAARPIFAAAALQKAPPTTSTIIPYCIRIIWDANIIGPKTETTMKPI